jgi:tRNA(Ile)-lysidine synthase
VFTAQEFATAMAPLGPFEPSPQIAAGVSGGADSMALALLADTWAQERGGSLLALVIDHGLRPESAREAAATVERLGSIGIAARLLPIGGLARGSALAERARAARFAALEAACAAMGILHLLLGHHAADQAETLLIRALGGSGPAGMAGMAPLVETTRLRLLRPLLAVPPGRLRATLSAAGVAWVEDPSNADRAALRPRLRLLRRDRDGDGAATAALVAAAAASGRSRAGHDRNGAANLAAQVSLRPEGFALLSGQALDPPALAALLQALAGASFPPATRSLVALAAAPRPATLAGVRLLPAGRLGPGMLAVREPAAMAPPVPARPGAVWDGRFRLGDAAVVPPDATLGALGDAAAPLRRFSSLPAAVLRTLPAIRRGETLLAVPHLVYPDRKGCECYPMQFDPPRPAAAAPFGFGDA